MRKFCDCNIVDVLYDIMRHHIPMKYIQEWLGHANFATTADVYSHLDYSSKMESASVIAEALSDRQVHGSNGEEPLYDSNDEESSEFESVFLPGEDEYDYDDKQEDDCEM